jgi:short-subunit dehydrogenase
MKTASVTGASNGIGKAIVDLLKLNQYSVLEFDIERDISVPENRQYIVNESIDCDVFINNAWTSTISPESQLDMFQDFVTAWHDDKDKHIINMGSLMKSTPQWLIGKANEDEDDHQFIDKRRRANIYRVSKKDLYKHTILKHLDASILCKISIAQPGFTKTEFAQEYMFSPGRDHQEMIEVMQPAQVARQILDIIESPVHVIETSFRLR